MTTPMTLMRTIWSVCHCGPLDADHVIGVMDRAVSEGVHHIELGGHATDLHRFVYFKSLPALAGAVKARQVERQRAALNRIVDHAARKDVRLGMWHHELSGPASLLDVLPGLRAADGWVDLDSPVLYDYIRAAAVEFFQDFPGIDELVVTLTESHIPVAHRPFCDIPVAERIRRVLATLAEVTERLGKTLVIRPFSAVRSDELHVREAVGMLQASGIVLMYKTEPFDWHPFLENEPLIGSVSSLECRAEMDCGAEYYGQAAIPVCYLDHLQRRIRAAGDKGATVAVLRVDRGAPHPSLGTPVNEANIIPLTRWLRGGPASLDDELCRWIAQTHGCTDPALAVLFERTFDVIRDALYIDQHAISHLLFPTLNHARHIQLFGLFEPGISLEHMKGNWSVLSQRRTPSHADLLAQKDRAMRTAGQLRASLETLHDGLPANTLALLRVEFEKLEVLAAACRQLCRLIAAHTADVWRLPNAADAFHIEADRMNALADDVERRFGLSLFPREIFDDRHIPITVVMRDWVTGLREERRLPRPRPHGDVLDEIACGFTTEGHRLAKRLHTGAVVRLEDGFAREPGVGEDNACTYRLTSVRGAATQVRITLFDDGVGRPGGFRVAGVERIVDGAPFRGTRTFTIDVPASDCSVLFLSCWSTTDRAMRLMRIQLTKSLPASEPGTPGKETSHVQAASL